jgi:amidase
MGTPSIVLLISAFTGAFYSVWLLFASPALIPSTQIDLLTVTVRDIVGLLENGTITSEQLVTQYLARIDENNYRGLKLRAVLEVAPYDSLIEQARRCDVERKGGHVQGPLHGIPILVKDNIATDPSLGMNTTAGSFALRLTLPFEGLIVVGTMVPRDATVVEKLRKAGAIILGKANLSEFSQFKAINNTDGWSARGGQTQAAYVVGGYALMPPNLM